jgi:hypothetical protein
MEDEKMNDNTPKKNEKRDFIIFVLFSAAFTAGCFFAAGWVVYKIVAQGERAAAMFLFAAGWLATGVILLPQIISGIRRRRGKIVVQNAAKMKAEIIALLAFGAALLGAAIAANRFGVDMGIASIQRSPALVMCPSVPIGLAFGKITKLRRMKKEQQAENAADAEEKSAGE